MKKLLSRVDSLCLPVNNFICLRMMLSVVFLVTLNTMLFSYSYQGEKVSVIMDQMSYNEFLDLDWLIVKYPSSSNSISKLMGCNAPVTVGTDVNVPDLSTAIAQQLLSPGFTGGQNFAVCGTFSINEDYILLNNTIDMQNGATITIDNISNVFISGNLFSSCSDSMWHGIVATDTVVLNVRNNQFRDAEMAIQLMSDEIEIDIVSNIFTDNYISVDISDQPKRHIFVNNLHQSTGALLPPSMTSGVSTRSYTGYNIRQNAINIAIGAIATGSERFENLANGILSRNANVTVTNSKFTNMLTDANYQIEGYGIATAGNENHTLTQTGLLDITPLGITFENCPVGIRTVGMNIISSRNGMINVARGIEATNSFRTSFEIFSNEIEATQFGINLNNNLRINVSRINDNTIEMSGGAAAGIHFLNHSFVTPAFPVFGSNQHSGNTITLTNGSSMAGIFAKNSSELDICSNDITLDDSQGVTGSFGLFSNNSTGLFIRENNVTGSDSWSNNLFESNNAFDIDFSGSALYACNTSDRTMKGWVFDGACANSTIRSSNIGNHSSGLEYSATTAPGVQDHEGNNWNGTNYIFNAAVNFDTSLNLIQNNRFIVHTTQGTTFFPNNIQTPNAPGANWFENLPGTPRNCPNGSVCPTSEFPSTEFTDLDKEIAQSNPITSGYPTDILWIEQRRLLERLYTDASGAAPVLLSFAASNQHTPIGKIAQVGVNLKTALLPDETTALDYQAKYEEVVDASVAYYDLTELYAAADSQSQVLIRPDLIQKTDELVQLNVELNSIRQLIMTDQNNDLTTLLEFTSTIPENNLKVKNLKTIYTILINQLVSINGQLTASDIPTLQLLASECPYTDGMAVFEAQGLLALNDQYGWVTYNCNGSGNKVQYSEPTLYKMTINPNPAQDQININGLSFKDIDIYTVDIISIDGKLIKSVSISSGNHQINTSDLTNGMYLINVHTDKRFISTQKLVIQR